MGRLRLCLLFPHVVLGGGETSMMEIGEGLVEEFDVSVAAFDNLETGNAPTIRRELKQRFVDVTLLRQRWQLRPLLEKADVLLWYGVVPRVPRTLLALDRRPISIRVVHTDRRVDGEGFQRRWRHAIDGVVCVNPAAARKIPGSVFIPNTVSETCLQGPARAFFPRVGGRKTLGFLGRLVPLKNVRWLMENIELLGCNLLLQALDTELLSVRQLQQEALSRGLASRIHFLPPGRDVGTLLRSVDALVVASRHEGLPMVVIEAGLVGTPVISTRVGALPELFSAEILFVDFAAGDDARERVPSVASLRQALGRVDPSWGVRLRGRVSRLCSRPTVVKRYLDFIHQTLRVDEI